MSFTAIAISGFTTGCGFAALVCSVMSGFYATSKALAEI